MAIAVTETLLTADEFAALPEPPEGGKTELVRGRVVTQMPVAGEHGELQLIIGSAFRAFLADHPEGRAGVEVGYVLRADPDTVRAPDVSVAQLSSLAGGKFPRSFIHGAPLLAVEVVSEHDAERDLLAKVGDYLDAGTERVWVVRPKNRTVVVFCADGEVRPIQGDAALTSDDAGFAAAGFSLPLSALFD